MVEISAIATRIGWRSTSISSAPSERAGGEEVEQQRVEVREQGCRSCRASRAVARRRRRVGLGDVALRLPVEELLLAEPHRAGGRPTGRSGTSLTMRIASSGQASTHSPQKMQRE